MQIVLCGNYGAGNIGDEAILRSVLAALQQEYPDAHITVLCSYPETEQMYLADAGATRCLWLLPGGIRSLLRGIFKGELKKTLDAIQTCDLFILGGGGLFADDESRKAVFLWGIHLLAAKYYKRVIRVEAIGIGPLHTWFGRWFTKKALASIQTLSVRDQESKNLLNSLSIESEITVDPVFNLKIQQKSPSGIKKPYIIFSIRPWKLLNENSYKIIAQTLDSIIIEYGFDIRFVPFQQMPQNDTEIMNKIIVHMKYSERQRARRQSEESVPQCGTSSERSRAIDDKSSIFVYEYTPDIQSILALFQHAQFVIGMRLHSIIFAILTETPFVMIAYSNKGYALLKSRHFCGTKVPLLIVSVKKLEKLNACFKMVYAKSQEIREWLKQVKNSFSAIKQ